MQRAKEEAELHMQHAKEEAELHMQRAKEEANARISELERIADEVKQKAEKEAELQMQRAKEEADARISELERIADEVKEKAEKAAWELKEAQAKAETELKAAQARAVEAQEKSARDLVTRAQEMIEAREENLRLKQLLSASMRATDLTAKVIIILYTIYCFSLLALEIKLPVLMSPMSLSIVRRISSTGKISRVDLFASRKACECIPFPIAALRHIIPLRPVLLHFWGALTSSFPGNRLEIVFRESSLTRNRTSIRTRIASKRVTRFSRTNTSVFREFSLACNRTSIRARITSTHVTRFCRTDTFLLYAIV